ncbi:hypothetical protein F4808DRAFT_426174 [Astrocystis sublimbata]|nr:hypothetical protein F4808DRAFT_426174 [Astrocystis sublimbata]
MAPGIISWEGVLWVCEELGEDTGVQYTIFAMVEDDMMYYSRLDKPKADISFRHATDVLARIPDEEIFSQWSPDLTLTRR